VYDFESEDPDELPFVENEILTIVSKNDEGWWRARNSSGRIGLIPANYTEPYNA